MHRKLNIFHKGFLDMSNIRIFFSESLSLNLSSSLAKPQSHYLTKVMRVKIGEIFI